MESVVYVPVPVVNRVVPGFAIIEKDQKFYSVFLGMIKKTNERKLRLIDAECKFVLESESREQIIKRIKSIENIQMNKEGGTLESYAFSAFEGKEVEIAESFSKTRDFKKI